MTLRSNLFFAAALAMLIVSCGDSSTSGNDPDDLSSSSVLIPDSSDDGSSEGGSSVAPEGSSEGGSSVTPGGSSEGESGSSEVSSSSEEESSSSEEESSSSSEESSSSEALPLCGTVPYDSTTHLCDVRDSAIYEMVRIGSQTWMKENLNFDYKIDGASFGTYCYNNSADSCAKYGKLYTWAAAMDSATTGCGYGKECEADTGRVQGICPNGWHLPDSVEWRELFTATAATGDPAGTALKTETGWHDNGNGTNSSGFSAVPSGFMNSNGQYDVAAWNAYFWSSKENDGNKANNVRLYYGYTYPLQYNYDKKFGHAVRCLKN